ncbi:MAG TPA: VCBS repeat-containing protein, partial [Ignavibacteriaceae bacterium]|nr:VCBS repeat-containing protein [Ignavibacteriaceae bacterium]
MQEQISRLHSGNKKHILIGINTFVLIFLFSSTSDSQIPVNGFCKYNSHKIQPEYNSLYAVNYNDDSYTDLLLFNNTKKEIIQLEGSSSGNFEKQLSYYMPYEISKMVRLSDKTNQTLGYAFSSRKEMSVGIFKLLKNGRPVIAKKIKFKSYPENICTADIDKDDKPELLVSGGSFEGLAVLKENKESLEEIYIDKKNCYTGAIFIDLTNDGTPDVAAYNLISGSLVFFYNDGKGNFRKERSFNFPERIHSFKVFDVNLDSYEDLMFISGRAIYIMYGDFRSSYEKRTVVATKYTPDSFVIGDYNRDGRIDLIYLNKSKSLISALFAEDKSSFYPEIVMILRPRLSNLITYYSKFFRGIAAISEDGFIYT